MGKTLWIINGYLIALAMLALTLHLTSPGPGTQEILGVIIASGHDETFISGRSLSCTPKRWDAAPLSLCSININGRELVIQASRNPPANPNQLGGNCLAFYNGESQPCNIRSKTESVHWVARVYLSELTEIEQVRLQQYYFLHNLSEHFYLYSLPVVASLTALIFGLAIYLGNRKRAGVKSILLISSITGGLAAGFFAFCLWYMAVVSVVI